MIDGRNNNNNNKNITSIKIKKKEILFRPHYNAHRCILMS